MGESSGEFQPLTMQRAPSTEYGHDPVNGCIECRGKVYSFSGNCLNIDRWTVSCTLIRFFVANSVASTQAFYIQSPITQVRQSIQQVVASLGLVRETKAHTEWREDKALECIFCCKVVTVLGNSGHIRFIKVNQFPVILNARGGDGFGENGGAAGNWEMIRIILLMYETK